MKHKFFEKVLSLFPLKNNIIFESNPDYSCNTFPVFCELKCRLPKYKFVWYTKKSTPMVNGVDDVVYNDDKGVFNRMKLLYYKWFSKVLICSNIGIKKQRKDQLSICLTHGSVTKRTKGMYEPGVFVDYISVQSHFFDKLTEEECGASPNKFIYLGFPRCDYFFEKNDAVCKQLEKIGVKGKYIVWLPTFRKQTISGRDAHSKQFESMGIPLVYSEQMLKELDDFLVKKDIYICYKPHPVYEIPTKTCEGLRNMRIIRDNDLQSIGIQLYQLLAYSEALITDYSSVYFDYLLLDRPMATTLDDVDCWKKGNGFAFDLEKLYAETNESLYSLDDLFRFIDEVVIQGKDTHEEARLRMRDLTNIHKDGNSAKRVAGFIVERLKVS